MRKLSRAYRLLFLALPAVLYFSYYPIIGLGGDKTMNFELSLPLLVLVIFDLIAVVLLFKEKRIKDILKYKLWFLFPVWVALSVIWSLNVTRGILTAGVLWVILVAGVSIVIFRNTILKGTWESFKKVLYAASAVVVGWCLVQCFLDVLGVSREVTLLCPGCTKEMFGFPHPNGFAIEPQFMGNLLLAPALLAAWEFLENQCGRRKDAKVKWRLLCPEMLWFCLFSFGVFLTFSRGAIYAYGVGTMFLVAFSAVRLKKWRPLILIGAMGVMFLFTLNLQGIFSQISGMNETYGSGIAKVVNQLSLGAIDLKGDEQKTSDDKNDKKDTDTDKKDTKEEEKTKPVFDGYVAESTETRVRLTSSAIKIWKKDFKTMAVGVGMGGAGQALFNNQLSPAPKEIVQNEYASVLLETGLIGEVLFMMTIGMAVFVAWKKMKSGFMLALILAYGVTLLFFSGYPNVLHIYLLPVAMAAVLPKQKI